MKYLLVLSILFSIGCTRRQERVIRSFFKQPANLEVGKCYIQVYNDLSGFRVIKIMNKLDKEAYLYTRYKNDRIFDKLQSWDLYDDKFTETNCSNLGEF